MQGLRRHHAATRHIAQGSVRARKTFARACLRRRAAIHATTRRPISRPAVSGQREAHLTRRPPRCCRRFPSRLNPLLRNWQDHGRRRPSWLVGRPYGARDARITIGGGSVSECAQPGMAYASAFRAALPYKRPPSDEDGCLADTGSAPRDLASGGGRPFNWVELLCDWIDLNVRSVSDPKPLLGS